MILHPSRDAICTPPRVSLTAPTIKQAAEECFQTIEKHVLPLISIYASRGEKYRILLKGMGSGGGGGGGVTAA